mgnify:CR=1 FL=1|tara:strand:+ start:171 stop:677 length:507 start_codon:yes stop_codon:yes gene_type:complete
MKKKSKSKSPIQIIAAIGLVIAILWTAKGFFQFGGAGYKEVKSKVSKSSGLPLLRCVGDNNGKDYIDIIDLDKINSNQPSDLAAATKKPNASFDWLNITEEEYFINYVRHSNGFKKGYILNIDRSTGVGEYIFPPKRPVDSSLADNIDAMMKADTFPTVCEKIKRKKL